jgi:putative ABC transport system permease protein
MYHTNFKIAFRNLWKNRGFSLINIGGLAIGLACCLLLLLYVNYEWSYDRQYQDADRIYRVKVNIKVNGTVYTTPASPPNLAGAALQEIPAVEYAARMTIDNAKRLFSTKENDYKLSVLNVDPSYLKIFSYHYIYGDASSALNEPNDVLLTSSAAKKLFGDENPVGRSVKWDNRKELKVTAVIEDLPKNQTIQFDALQTWAFFEGEDPSVKDYGWGMITCETIIKLKNKSDFAATDVLLRKFIASKQSNTALEAFLLPLTQLHLYNRFENGRVAGGRIEQVNLFFFLALSVMLIACVNYMNLSTARSEKRGREVGVRKALGATKMGLMAQFITESLLLSFFAMLVAFALLELSLPYFNHLLDISIQIDYGSYLFWLTLVLLILITGLLAGSYPAFYLSSFIPVKVLKGFTGKGKSSLPVRKILVIFQFSLSICMIICAIIIYTQIRYLKNKPLGFQQNNLVQMDLEGEWAKPTKRDLFKEELKKMGAILSATEFASPFVLSGNVTGDLVWPGKSVEDDALINYRSTGFEFSKTIGVTMVLGRDFSPSHGKDSVSSVLVNETAVKTMNLKSPVGSIIRWGTKPFTVIGVVKDYTSEDPGHSTKPTLYYYSKSESKVMLLRLNPAKPLGQSIEIIKRICRRLNAAYPADLEFVSQSMESKLESERLLSVLSNLFGGFAVFISCLGLLGLALYMAEQRNKEISIRKVLGAGLDDILILLNGDFIKLVLISNTIAFPLAYIIANNWLTKYDYKVDMTVWPFLTAAVMSIIIAVLTVSLQTFKVANANAADALKSQ